MYNISNGTSQTERLDSVADFIAWLDKQDFMTAEWHKEFDGFTNGNRPKRDKKTNPKWAEMGLQDPNQVRNGKSEVSSAKRGLGKAIPLAKQGEITLINERLDGLFKMISQISAETHGERLCAKDRNNTVANLNNKIDKLRESVEEILVMKIPSLAKMVDGVAKPAKEGSLCQEFINCLHDPKVKEEEPRLSDDELRSNRYLAQKIIWDYFDNRQLVKDTINKVYRSIHVAWDEFRVWITNLVYEIINQVRTVFFDGTNLSRMIMVKDGILAFISDLLDNPELAQLGLRYLAPEMAVMLVKSPLCVTAISNPNCLRVEAMKPWAKQDIHWAQVFNNHSDLAEKLSKVALENYELITKHVDEFDVFHRY